MRARIRRDLTAAMKTRDATATVVLRSALAAIENAEAVVPADDDASGSEHVAGAVLGVGASDVPRRTLTDADVVRLLRAERDDRLSAAATLDTHGRTDRADLLRAEAGVLDRYLP